ncbi:MAG: c-type cytochrome [Gemmatimonadaceae bacterium]
MKPMRLHRGVTTAALCCAALAPALATACRREERRYRETPPTATPPGTVRLSPLQPGEPAATPHLVSGYDENAYAVSEGQRLFGWYNCSGCHANGGGGMGPPLTDDQWIYGSAPENIHETIVEGRPNGMPSFAGRIPDSQVWQIVAYVRSLSALTPASTRAARTDHMMNTPGSQSLQTPKKPKQSFRPPASEQP